MEQKTDRRTRYTRRVIKESFLELLQKQRFSKVTVTAICKQAEITRATFYLHYVDIYAVLDEVLTEALEISEKDISPETSLAMFLQAGKEADSAAFIKEKYDLLPPCQRVADHPQYQALFTDEDLGPYILEYIFSHQKDAIVPLFQKQFNLSPVLAENLYLFLVSGSFAINQHHQWKKDETWFTIQSMILRFIYHGSLSFEKET
ncbi:TetR/AcrR family transcriptional regulator [uncultured Megasphaera sp.]|uniref:TetR/AcrR family transcriptional regulator n=1 Tax=Megasphaera massiliensis TaxID=1232428 RepID=UPI00266BE4DE|nr:TetR/AcrR family transcriptional regulator [uncultured Megasphaera sp.]